MCESRDVGVVLNFLLRVSDTSRMVGGRDGASVIIAVVQLLQCPSTAPPTPHTRAAVAIARASAPCVPLSLNTCCFFPLAFPALGNTHDPIDRAAHLSIVTASHPSQHLQYGSVRLTQHITAIARLLMHRQLGRLHGQEVDGRSLAVAAGTTRQLRRVAISACARRLRSYHRHPEPLRLHSRPLAITSSRRPQPGHARLPLPRRLRACRPLRTSQPRLVR